MTFNFSMLEPEPQVPVPVGTSGQTAGFNFGMLDDPAKAKPASEPTAFDDSGMTPEFVKPWTNVAARFPEDAGRIKGIRTNPNLRAAKLWAQVAPDGYIEVNPDLAARTDMEAILAHELEHSRGGDERAANAREAAYGNGNADPVRPKSAPPADKHPSGRDWSDLEREVLGLPPKQTTRRPSAVAAEAVGGLPGLWLASQLPEWVRKPADALLAPALRVAPAVAGGVLGAAVGGPIGAVVGGGIGAGAGETGAESLEILSGQREALNPTQIAAQTAVGAVPVLGRAGSVPAAVLSRGVQGAALGGGGAAATALAEGERPSTKDVLIGAGMGAVLGGAGGAVEARAVSRAAAAVPKPAPAVAGAGKGFDFSMFDSPVDDAGRVLGGTVGPERRSAARVSTPAEDARYARMRDKIAAGEPTGSAELREVGQRQSALETAREQASKDRGEAPLPRGASEPAALVKERGAQATAPDDFVYHGTNVDIADAVLSGSYFGTRDEAAMWALTRASSRGGEPRVYAVRRSDVDGSAIERLPEGGYRSGLDHKAIDVTDSILAKEAPAGAAPPAAAPRPPGGGDPPAALAKAETKPEPPTLAGIQNHGNGTMSVQFDRAGAPVSVEDVKAMFPGRNVRVSKFEQNILSPHLQKFRIDVLDEHGRISSKTATELEQEIGGSFHDWQRAGERAYDAAAAARGGGSVPPRPPADPPALPPGGGDPPRSVRVPQDAIPPQRPLTADRKADDRVFIDHQPEPFREGLKDIVAKNNHYEAQRRGTQPVERTNALAQWVQVERMKTLPKGTALNAEQLKAYADNIATVTDRIDDLSKKVMDGSATFADQAALTAARHEQGVLLASAFGARAETGRALNIHKQFAQIFESKDAQAIRAAMGVEGINPTEVARKLAELPTDAAKLEYIRSLQKRTWGQMARGLYFSNILSGVRTHVRNVLGNTANGIFNNAANIAAVGYDAGRSAVTGQARTIFLSELQPRAAGAAFGVQQGIEDALFTLQHGYTPSQVRTFDIPRPELPGGGKNPLNWVGRSLEAEDQLFYAINYHSELFARLHAKARSEALKKGLKGEAADTLILDRLTNWKLNPPLDVTDAARQAALRAVFKEDPGQIVGAILNLKREAPILDFVMPFVRTPANILRQGIEATPLAPLTKQTRTALKAGGRESAEAVGRMVTGSTALAALAYVASQGKLSGAGPRDPEKRAALMENGWRPYSIKAGDKWISYTDFIQPLSQPMFAIANAYDRYLEGEKVTPDAIAGKAGEALLDQSFLAGVSDFFRAMSDWDRHGEQFVQRVTQGAIPASGMARNVTQAIDPVVREPKTLVEGVKSVTPGLSTQVSPKLDRFGAEVEREGGPLVRGLSPVNVGTTSKDPVVVELTRLNVSDLGLPPKKLQEAGSNPAIDLTTDERKRMGAAVREELERLFKHPSWRRLDEDVARERIKNAAARGRRRVSQAIRAERRKATR